MLIILEGPDGVGKTTFTEQLRTRLTASQSVHVLRKGPPKSHPLDEYEVPLHTYRPEMGVTVICDRWHLGELVYPAVLGRDSQYDRAVRRHVDMFLVSRGAVLVRLVAPLDVLTARVRERGDDLIHPRLLSRLVREYDHATRVSRLPVAVLTERDRASRACVSDVIAFAARHARRAAGLNGFVTYVGPRVPAYLLLGDTRNLEVPAAHPAFGPYPATSGHYLLSHMRRWRDVGIANACDVDDAETLWSVLGRPNVVTLGALAHRRLSRVPHGSAPHPQFVRRFLHHHGGAYGELIDDVSRSGEDRLRWRP